MWNEHLRAEFSAHSADEAVATMVAHPRVHQVPVMIGGEGKDEVYEFGSCVTTVRDVLLWPHGGMVQTGQRTLVTHEPGVFSSPP